MKKKEIKLWIKLFKYISNHKNLHSLYKVGELEKLLNIKDR